MIVPQEVVSIIGSQREELFKNLNMGIGCFRICKPSPSFLFRGAVFINSDEELSAFGI